MGRREFYAWVDQRHREEGAQRPDPYRWRGDDQGWRQQAHAKRDKLRGR